MIDIHCHLLYGVDDGADSLEESVKMLEKAKKQGVETIILTPHYRHGMFPFHKSEVKKHFSDLKKYAEDLEIKLYLGTEYHIDSDCIPNIQSGRCLTLAGSSYVLTEYSYETKYSYMRNMTQELLVHGYVPVIAHVERYQCLIKHPEYIDELRKTGAWIQVNADAVLGLEGWKTKRMVNKLLKHSLVDVIASDSHGISHRVCNMEKCKKYLQKKYGTSFAELLMKENPSKILEEY